MDDREAKGRVIAQFCKIKRDDDGYVVSSQAGKGRYRVHLDPYPKCNCPDYELRANKCKHIHAVEYSIRREQEVTVQPNADGTVTATERVTVTATKRVTYKQAWPAYNAAETNEKERFQELLGNLCEPYHGPEDAPGPKGGRPGVPLASRLFAIVFKVYSTFSSRRFACDLQDAHAKGYLPRVPHFNSVLRYLDDPAMTPLLSSMIAESAKPLASVEQDFAADSSGFTTCRFESWFDHKYGIVRRQHEWVKVHLMCGVKTNIVTAVEIRDKDASDTKLLPDLVHATAKNFAIREVSADKGYGSLNNYEVIERYKATPYIAFKSIHTGAGGGLWAKMFHYFNFNRDEYLTHYHKRSNVESTFSMMKAKFGDALRSKTNVAMVNETLCKVLCHNICCLIQSSYELGVNGSFWKSSVASFETDQAQVGDPWAWV